LVAELESVVSDSHSKFHNDVVRVEIAALNIEVGKGPCDIVFDNILNNTVGCIDLRRDHQEGLRRVLNWLIVNDSDERVVAGAEDRQLACIGAILSTIDRDTSDILAIDGWPVR